MSGSDQQTLKGKVAVVTGSSSGIGQTIAVDLAQRGAKVAIHSRKDSDGIRKTMSEVKKLGSECQPFFADFSEPKSLVPFVEQTWAWNNQIDIWINNAGGDVLTGANADTSFVEKLNYLQQVDVNSTLLMSKLVGKKMVEERLGSQRPTSSASIVNIGWDQALTGMDGDSGEMFATTKGAVMAMTKSLAQTLAPHVRVNCVAPGWIKTEWGDQASEYWDTRAKSESLMERWGTPIDVAHAVTFLASDDASFISGQILCVNGGFRSSWFSQNPIEKND
jgi:3-oxoacyl-[acyl-carrier protein] reductase